MKRFALLTSVLGGGALAVIPPTKTLAQAVSSGQFIDLHVLSDAFVSTRLMVGGSAEVNGGLEVRNDGITSTGIVGVVGTGTHEQGVIGLSTSESGVLGKSKGGPGVTGQTASSTAPGILGIGHRAALFQGNVGVNGIFAVHGFKAFKIDHPLDPSGAYLSHASIESSEVLNIYSGNCVLDERGEAAVSLPRWFEALNEDFRYQLSSIGAPNPNVYVRDVVHDNSFAIAGGVPGSTISWQITGKRRDAWIKDHPLVVEEPKTTAERGTYLHPESFGQPEHTGLAWREFPQYMRRPRDAAECSR